MSKTGIKIVPKVIPPCPFESYAHLISPLSEEEGGGVLVTFPDLPGCMSDGKSEAEAIDNARDAFYSCVSARIDANKPIPEPKYRPESTLIPQTSGRFVTRVPKSIHFQLAHRAEVAAVSLNALVLSLIAERLGRREQTQSDSVRP